MGHIMQWSQHSMVVLQFAVPVQWRMDDIGI